MLDVSQQSVSRWVKGTSRPREETVLRLEWVLRMDSGTLLAPAGYQPFHPDEGPVAPSHQGASAIEAALRKQRGLVSDRAAREIGALSEKILRLGPQGRRITVDVVDSLLAHLVGDEDYDLPAGTEYSGTMPSSDSAKMLRAAYEAEVTDGDQGVEAVKEKIKKRRGLK